MKNKTIKNNKNKNIVLIFLELLNMIKLFHWQTYQYSVHKSTDQLYEELSNNIDKYVEIMLGKNISRPNIQQKSTPLYSCLNLPSFLKQIDKYKKYFVHLKYSPEHSDLSNIRDEILGNLNQFTYLLSFK
jgi:dihydroorotate dehydrogenase